MNLGNREYSTGEDCQMSGEDESHRTIPSVEEAKQKFLQQAVPCPLCKTPPEQLTWVYLVIPQWACNDAEQNEGWVTICDRCKLQVDFFAQR